MSMTKRFHRGQKWILNMVVCRVGISSFRNYSELLALRKLLGANNLEFSIDSHQQNVSFIRAVHDCEVDFFTS
jgi:hypothetical protein